jgi:hypothetical protein
VLLTETPTAARDHYEASVEIRVKAAAIDNANTRNWEMFTLL